jgi:hypothetical protein
MKLKYVTLTGADDTVDPAALLDLSEKYPFAEWAILFSQSKSDVPRYPSLDWVSRLVDAAASLPEANLSAHLCGKWVDDAMRGTFAFFDQKGMDLVWSRFQLNMGHSRVRQAVKSETLLAGLPVGSSPIFGGNYDGIELDVKRLADKGVAVLFDASGGKGLETKVWPKAIDGLFCGYAGGLGPDTVVAELDRIAEAAGDATVWIDMESRVRTKADGKDVFDLAKCEQVLRACKPWVA